MAPPVGLEQNRPDPNPVEQARPTPEKAEKKEKEEAPAGNTQAKKGALKSADDANNATTELRGKVTDVDEAAKDAGVLPVNVRELQGITAKVEASTSDNTTVEASQGRVKEFQEQRKALVENEFKTARGKVKEIEGSLHAYVNKQRAKRVPDNKITEQEGYRQLLEQHKDAEKAAGKVQDQVHELHKQEIKEARELKDREDPPKDAVEGHMRDMGDAMEEFKTAKTLGDKFACLVRAFSSIMAAVGEAPHKSVGKTPEIQSKSKRRKEQKKDIEEKGSLKDSKKGKEKELKDVQGKIQQVHDAETGLAGMENGLQAQETKLEEHKAKPVPDDPNEAAAHNQQTADLEAEVAKLKTNINETKDLISQKEDLQKQEEALKKDVDELTEWEGEVKKNAERATSRLRGMSDGGEGKLSFLGEVAVKSGADGISLEWEIKPGAEMHLQKALGDEKYKELTGEDPTSVKDSAAFGVVLQGLIINESEKEKEKEKEEGEEKEGEAETGTQASEISHEGLPKSIVDAMDKYIPDEDIPGFTANLNSLEGLHLDIQHPGNGKVTMEVRFKNSTDGREIVKMVKREWKTEGELAPSHEKLAHYDAIATVLNDAIRADRMAKMKASSA